MHLSEGVLHTPILLAGAVLAVAGIAVGLRRLESERLPLTALFAAAFFFSIMELFMFQSELVAYI